MNLQVETLFNKMEHFTEFEEENLKRKFVNTEDFENDKEIVKDILDQLKPNNNQNKDEISEIDLEKLLNKYEKNKNDAIVEEKLENIRPTANVIELNQLDLNRFDANLLREFRQIQYLYLQDNRISSLQIDFFTILNRLKYLDLRNNALVTLPCSICYHECLEILLLQGNCITRVPKEIGSLPKLRGLQLSQNPITYPTPSVLSRGSSAIIEYLRQEWVQYEREATGQSKQNRNGGGALATANSVQIKAKEMKPDSTTSAGSAKRNSVNKRTSKNKLTSLTEHNISGDGEIKTVSTLGSDKTSTMSTLPSGVEHGTCENKTANIDFKPDPVCMFVNKIKPGRMKKNLHQPYCTEETEDTWSTSNQSFSGSVTEIVSPLSKPSSSKSSSTPQQSRKKQVRKMKHYTEILNPYKPFGNVKQSLDDQQTQAMYLRRLIEIHMKFIAANKEKQLQRMKNTESLDKWRDEYRMRCSKANSGDSWNSQNTKVPDLPYAVYEEFQKMLSRADLTTGLHRNQSKPSTRGSIGVVDKQRNLETKMIELQKMLQSLDSIIKPRDEMNRSSNSNEMKYNNELNRKLNSNEMKYDNTHRPDISTEVEKSEIARGKLRQNQLLQQIYKMQGLQNQVKHLSQINDTLI